MARLAPLAGVVSRIQTRIALLGVLLWLIPGVGTPQGIGKLQIHQLNIGQGDAALIVSPLGQTMLIDTGPLSASSCAGPTGIVTQLIGLGVTRLDYHVASHYDADHIGCTDRVVANWPVQVAAFDRGTVNPPTTQTYSRYATAVAANRQTLTVGQVITLDGGGANPVTFDVIAVNANGGGGSLTENDRSIVLRLRFGAFDAVFGGDLTGEVGSTVHDIESRIAAAVGQVELYKVHHHGSATSSNPTFMSAVHPKVAAVSMSATNSFGHPTATALGNIHATGATVYWTTVGNGATPGLQDVVAFSTILTGVPVGGQTFTVTAGGVTDSYASWGVQPGFTDDPLEPGISVIRLIHMTELRTRIDALRTQHGLSPFNWTDPDLSNTFVKTIHLIELRTALADVYTALGRAQPAYTDATLQPGITSIRVLHIAELRAAVIAVE